MICYISKIGFYYEKNKKNADNIDSNEYQLSALME